MEVKTCSKCDLRQSVNNFTVISKNTGRLRPECKTCCSAIAKDKRQKMPEHHKANVLRYKYNLSMERYYSMLVEQDGVCAICRGSDLRSKKYFSVDHDHNCCAGNFSCGMCIRGLLCTPCNQSIGMMKDDPERLRKAADYLELYDYRQQTNRKAR